MVEYFGGEGGGGGGKVMLQENVNYNSSYNAREEKEMERIL